LGTSRTKSTLETQLAQLISGIQKNLASATFLLIANKSYTPAECVQILQALLTASQAIGPLRAQWQNAVENSRLLQAANKQFVDSLRKAILAMFTTVGTLADFGLTPPKAAVTSPVTKVVASAKGLATRKKRNTMGSRQKLDVVGNPPATLAIDVPTEEITASPAPVVVANPPPGASNGASVSATGVANHSPGGGSPA
jgi:hypothetical protein